MTCAYPRPPSIIVIPRRPGMHPGRQRPCRGFRVAESLAARAEALVAGSAGANARWCPRPVGMGLILKPLMRRDPPVLCKPFSHERDRP